MKMLRLFLFALLIAGAAACDPVEGIPRKYSTDEPTDTWNGTDSAAADLSGGGQKSGAGDTDT